MLNIYFFFKWRTFKEFHEDFYFVPFPKKTQRKFGLLGNWQKCLENDHNHPDSLWVVFKLQDTMTQWSEAKLLNCQSLSIYFSKHVIMITMRLSVKSIIVLGSSILLIWLMIILSSNDSIHLYFLRITVHCP